MKAESLVLAMRLISRVLIVASAIAIVACTMPEGPIGPRGPQGEQGPQGEPGDPAELDVRLYILAGHDFSISAFAYRDLPGIGARVQELMFFVYLVDTNFGVYYPVPGAGISAQSLYRVWWLRTGNSVSVRINRHDGPGEQYGEIRVITIPITQMPSTRAANALDFDDYDAVIMHFGLQEEQPAGGEGPRT